MLKMRFQQETGSTVDIQVDYGYRVTSEFGSLYRDQVEDVVRNITDRHLHGGAPSLHGLIWSSIKANYPNVKLVLLSKPPPEPDSEFPRVY